MPTYLPEFCSLLTSGCNNHVSNLGAGLKLVSFLLFVLRRKPFPSAKPLRVHLSRKAGRCLRILGAYAELFSHQLFEAIEAMAVRRVG